MINRAAQFSGEFTLPRTGSEGEDGKAQMPRRVVLNVGGNRFETLDTTLASQPDTKLSDAAALGKHWSEQGGEYFFDRNSVYFESILDYYRTGDVHIPSGGCVTRVLDELQFWKIPLSALDSCVEHCCHLTEQIPQVNQARLSVVASNSVTVDKKVSLAAAANENRWARIQRKGWLLLDCPVSSKWAKVPFALYLFAALVSVVCHALASYPYFRLQYRDHEIAFINATFQNMENQKIYRYITSVRHPVLHIAELISILYLTLDMLARIIFCPSAKHFGSSIANLLDVVCLLSGWTQFICLTLYVHSVTSLMGSSESTFTAVIYVLFVVRGAAILRIFRLMRYLLRTLTGQAMYLALKSTWSIIASLVFVFFALSHFFGTLVYTCELMHPTNMPDILVAMWWALITMTTVGYGDTVPLTVAGKVVGCFCALCGIITLAMTMAVLSKNFTNIFEALRQEESEMGRQKKATKLAKLHANGSRRSVTDA